MMKTMVSTTSRAMRITTATNVACIGKAATAYTNLTVHMDPGAISVHDDDRTIETNVGDTIEGAKVTMMRSPTMTTACTRTRRIVNTAKAK